MFDLTKTIVCGVGKAFVGALATVGGAWILALLCNEKYQKNELEAIRKSVK